METVRVIDYNKFPLLGAGASRTNIVCHKKTILVGSAREAQEYKDYKIWKKWRAEADQKSPVVSNSLLFDQMIKAGAVYYGKSRLYTIVEHYSDQEQNSAS